MAAGFQLALSRQVPEEGILGTLLKLGSKWCCGQKMLQCGICGLRMLRQVGGSMADDSC